MDEIYHAKASQEDHQQIAEIQFMQGTPQQKNMIAAATSRSSRHQPILAL